MVKESSLMWPMLIIVAGAGIGGYIWMQRDKTPVGLVVTNAIQGGRSLGENSDGGNLTAGLVEGTWREDENSTSVASESAEKPLMVIYKDGTPIHAEVFNMSDFEPPKCEEGDEDETAGEYAERCNSELEKARGEIVDYWKKVGKEHGATDESLDSIFPKEEESTQPQEAESIYGPMLSLQSHFMW